MSKKNGQCELHPEKKCTSIFNRKKEDKTSGKAEDKPTEECDNCAPWQRYMLYAIPLFLYIPWAIRTMRCPPKCCPPPQCCPPPPPKPPKMCCPEPPSTKVKCPKKKSEKKKCEEEHHEEED